MFINDKRRARAVVIRAIRDFFHDAAFIETDTPSLVLSPGMEPHIRPLQIHNSQAYLPTSPEFAMKRLLSLGYDRIFQVCKAYRLEPKSTTHNPEFTMLEWYRANSGYEAIMDDVENLFKHISKELHAGTKFATPNGNQDVGTPWVRLTVEECFRRFAKLRLTELLTLEAMTDVCIKKGYISTGSTSTWDDLFFRVMMNDVEPELAKLGTPIIVYHYPESQAALSNIITDDRGFRWAKRFEVYAGGLELGNAFDELTDVTEQRRRFEKDMKLRKELYGDEFAPSPIDESFLKALEKMPASGGIAMGVDRIVMYFTGAESIDDVLWLPSYFSKETV